MDAQSPLYNGILKKEWIKKITPEEVESNDFPGTVEKNQYTNCS